MPAKKAEAAAPEEIELPKPPYLDRVRENCEADEGGEGMCYDVVQEVVRRAEQQMLDNYYERAAVPYTVQCVCREMLDVVQFVFIARDPGEMSQEALESWVPDEEPEPCPTDTWARSAVPVRKPAPAPPPSSEPADGDGAGRHLRSPGANRGSRPSAATHRARPAPSQQAQAVKGRGEGSSPPGSDDKGEAGARAAAVRAELAEAAAAAGEEAVRGDEDDQQGGAAGREGAERRHRAEVREAAERQHASLRELRGQREYCVDSINGKIIPVKPVDPKRLPARRLDMRIAVEADAEEAKPRAAGAAAARKARRGDAAERHVQPEDTPGPMVEPFEPTHGVCVKQGERVLRSERRKSRTRVSRKEFKTMLDQMGVQREPFDITQNSNADEMKAAAQAAAAEVAAPTGAVAAAEAREREQRRAAAAAAAQTPASPASPAAPAGGVAGGDAATLQPQAVAPLPPFKPQREDMRTSLLGSRAQYPRERGAAAAARSPRPGVESPAEATRPQPLPPPLYPASEGHGALRGPLAGDNPYAQGRDAGSPARSRQGGRDADSPPRSRGASARGSPARARVTRNPNEQVLSDVAEDFLADARGVAGDDDAP